MHQHGPGMVSLTVPLLDLSYPCLSLGCYSLLSECPRHSDRVSPLGSHQSSLALLSTLPSMYLKKVPSTRLAECPGHPPDSYPGLAGCWPCYLVGFFSSESPLVPLGIDELDSSLDGGSATPVQEMTSKSGKETNIPSEIPTPEGGCEGCGLITTDTCPLCSVYLHKFCACPW
jgi:hypothetical protein